MTRYEIASIDEPPEEEEIEQQLTDIFFATSTRKAFVDLAEKESFQHRWLDRYFYRYRSVCFFARNPDRRPIGYVVGCPVDPRGVPCFSDVTYFAAFADLLDRYPAHLHVNVSAERQGEGIGRALVARAVEACRAEGASGVHVVTAADAANIGFYGKCGLIEADRREVGGRTLLMLGRIC